VVKSVEQRREGDDHDKEAGEVFLCDRPLVKLVLSQHLIRLQNARGKGSINEAGRPNQLNAMALVLFDSPQSSCFS
jgi:hypothetical protein